MGAGVGGCMYVCGLVRAFRRGWEGQLQQQPPCSRLHRPQGQRGWHCMHLPAASMYSNSLSIVALLVALRYSARSTVPSPANRTRGQEQEDEMDVLRSREIQGDRNRACSPLLS